MVGSALWARDDVAITSLGGVSPRPIAGYVLAMVLAFAHHLPEAIAHQARREWPTPAERWERFMPRRLEGSTMVIVGYGRLGQGVARAATAFGIEVVGVRRGADRPGERRGEGLGDPARLVVGPDRLLEVLGEATTWWCACPARPRPSGCSTSAPSPR